MFEFVLFFVYTISEVYSTFILIENARYISNEYIKDQFELARSYNRMHYFYYAKCKCSVRESIYNVFQCIQVDKAQIQFLQIFTLFPVRREYNSIISKYYNPSSVITLLLRSSLIFFPNDRKLSDYIVMKIFYISFNIFL